MELLEPTGVVSSLKTTGGEAWIRGVVSMTESWAP
jgi:hypothetical protein